MVEFYGVFIEYHEGYPQLRGVLYVAEDTVINEYSSHIGEDMEKLEKIFKDRDIGEIRKFVLGVDEDESE